MVDRWDTGYRPYLRGWGALANLSTAHICLYLNTCSHQLLRLVVSVVLGLGPLPLVLALVVEELIHVEVE